MPTIQRLSAVAIVLAGISAWPLMAPAARTASQVKPPSPDYTSGPYLYRTFCASCHGTTGRGDGPVADLLSPRAPDLTTIARRSHGVFPRQTVHEVIDGRRMPRGHGSQEMPVWGNALKITEGHDDAIVKRRVDALVAYVETLQQR